MGVRQRFRLALVVATGFTALVVFAFAAPAWAHVTVDPSSAPRGAEITLGFRVPNEEATAATVKVQIFFPSNPPVLGVDPEEAPGWTNQVHTAPLNPPITTDDGPLTSYVNEVDWSGGPIPPGHFQEFYVLAQQLPTTGNQVVFKALQTYSDGNVVRWIQTTAPGLPEPAAPDSRANPDRPQRRCDRILQRWFGHPRSGWRHPGCRRPGPRGRGAGARDTAQGPNRPPVEGDDGRQPAVGCRHAVRSGALTAAIGSG